MRGKSNQVERKEKRKKLWSVYKLTVSSFFFLILYIYIHLISLLFVCSCSVGFFLSVCVCVFGLLMVRFLLFPQVNMNSSQKIETRNEIGFSFSQPSCRPILHPPSKWEKALKKQVCIKLVFFALD